jgi:hypothetical protein
MCCCIVVDFLCYCIVCIVRGCDKFHIQQSFTDIGSMECVYVSVNVNALNSKYTVGGLICDLAKAFDCINHDILLAKLQFYGLHNKNNALYNSYVTNRYQRTVILNNNGYHGVSNWVKIRKSVPQGSILGPLLFFFILMTYLCSFIKKFPVLFADDTSIIFAEPNIRDLQANTGILLIL